MRLDIFSEIVLHVIAAFIYVNSCRILFADLEIKKALQPWQDQINEFGNRVLGSTKVPLQQKECARGECNLGNFYTDAMLHAFIGRTPYDSEFWSNISVAMTTQGNFRVPLPQGNLTYNQLIAMCPWENKLYAVTLSGKIIRQLLESGVASMKSSQNPPSSSRFLQLSGIRVVYNISEPIGGRIVSVRVRCRYCMVPAYANLIDEQAYALVVMEYLLSGKNGFELIAENSKDIIEGPGDLEAFTKYMQVNEPIVAGLEGRITVLK